MKKIVFLPLDERPCNYNYPQMMPKADYNLVLPPTSIMGDKKKAGDVTAIGEWLLREAKDADACVVSMDTLIYGGIVPSRLHHETVNELINRADVVKKLRKINPKTKLYLFQLIMRCPSYSLSDEEPDYYDECGAEIFLYGKYFHLESAGLLTEEDKKDFDRVKALIKPKYLNDYVERRNKNLSVLMRDLEFIKDGVCDYFIVPQDDSAEYGFTAMNQMTVRSYLKENVLHLKTAMYPSADDTGLTLLARAVNELFGYNPKIYVKYASKKAETVVPWFEDRMLDETVKYQILAAGGTRVYSLPEADILLAINMGSGMYNKWQGEYAKAYDIERNLAEFTDYIKYALSLGKIVAVGDVATCNGADKELIDVLYAADLLLKIHAYAGWNTSSNTLGTAICEAILYFIGKDENNNKNFLLHRYYEDLGFMDYAREYVRQNLLPTLGITDNSSDGKVGKVSRLASEKTEEFMTANYPKLAEKVLSVYAEMPWRRTFEADIRLKTVYKNE